VRRFPPRLTVPALCATMLTFTAPLGAQANLSNAEWKLQTNSGGAALSSGDKTVTLQLPAPSQITGLYAFNVEVTFTSATATGSNHSMIPVNSNKPNILSCFEITAGSVPSNRHKSTSCKVEAATAKAVTSDQTITVTVSGTNGNKTLTAIIKPYTGPNYVATLQTVTASIYRGDLATFRIKLMSAVPSGQTQVVGWGLTPPTCFQNTTNSRAYNPNWTLSNVNTVTFQAGEIQRDVTVRVADLKTCEGGNRLFETWSPNTPNTQSSPTYKSHYFTILEK
jgi:hypothetical protein